MYIIEAFQEVQYIVILVLNYNARVAFLLNLDIIRMWVDDD